MAVVGILMPEKRLDRNGRFVTRHVRQIITVVRGVLIPRASITTPYMDSLERLHEEHLRELQDRVAEYTAHAIALIEESYRSRPPAKSGLDSESELSRHLASFHYRIDNVVSESRLKNMAPETITAVLSSFSGDSDDHLFEIFDILERDDEKTIREESLYRDVLRSKFADAHRETTLYDVGLALGVSDLSDVDPGSREYVHIQSVLEVAMSLRESRYDDILHRAGGAPQLPPHAKINLRWHSSEMHAEADFVSMSPALAKVIEGVPDKLEKIKAYLISGRRAPIEVDAGHLCEYLDSSTSDALSSGIL